MANYIFKMRRGIKDDSIGLNDWEEYELDPNHMLPLAGELVLEYDNGTPRLKIGDGVHKFSELPYMSVDSFILPRPTYIKLYGGEANWAPCTLGEANRFHQTVEVTNYTITPNSKIDLQLSQSQLAEFQSKDITFTTENNNGEVSVICVGEIPQNTHEIQVVITELLPSDKTKDGCVVGNTVGTPSPCTDWNQTDPRKSSFIKNKPNMEDYLTKDEAGDNYLTKDSADNYLTKDDAGNYLTKEYADGHYSTNKIYYGISEPDSSIGKDGDVYFMYTEE